MCSGKIRFSNILVYVEIGTGSKILVPSTSEGQNVRVRSEEMFIDREDAA